MMIIEHLCDRYGFNQYDFANFCDDNGIPIKRKIIGASTIEDAFAESAVEKYKAKLDAEASERQAMLSATSKMIITSGFTFDGYTITRYSGYISGDDVIQVPREKDGFFFGVTTDVGTALSEALVKLRRNALQELKEAAYELGCNAVIGVDFDYLTLDPETANANGGTRYLPYVFCVTANGNAVVIEKK